LKPQLEALPGFVTICYKTSDEGIGKTQRGWGLLFYDRHLHYFFELIEVMDPKPSKNLHAMFGGN